MSDSTATSTANVGQSPVKAFKGLMRNAVQTYLPQYLTAIIGFLVPSRFAVVGREKGYVTVTLPASYFPDVASFVESVSHACANMGIDFTLITGHVVAPDMEFDSPSLGNGVACLAFTNDTMQAQYNFGARGNSKLAREFRELASMASSIPSEAVQTETAPDVALTLDTSTASQPEAKDSKPAKASKGKGKGKGKGKPAKAS